jgi:SAM-dependent methyltransferase
MDNLRKLSEVWRSHLDESDTLDDHEFSFFPVFLTLARAAHRILEIGAGRGRMAKVLTSHGVKATIVCLDINDYVSEAPGLPVIADTRLLPFKDGAFDLVYSLGVVEHIEETGRAIAEHIRVTRKKGYALITTPHLSIYTPLRWIVWFLKYRKKGSFKSLMGSNLSIRQVKKWLLAAGGAVYRYGGCGSFLPGPLKAIRKYIKNFIPERYLGAYLWCLARRI